MDAQESTPQPGETGQRTVRKAHASLESLQADAVQLNQSSANLVSGNTVTLRDSSVRQINGETISINNSALGVAHGANLHLADSAVGICSATQADLTGNVGVMVGQSVSFTNHNSGLVIAREVHGNHVHAIIFLAGRSDAPVETIVDQRSVAMFGLATGIAMGLVFSLFRLLKR